MIVIEVIAAGCMVWMLVRAAKLVRRAPAEGGMAVFGLPIALHVTVAVMLGFAAFGGESGILADPWTSLMVVLGLGVATGVVRVYRQVLRRARAEADRRHGEAGRR
jgi:hypothetical protein